MRTILATIAFVLFTTPSWGERFKDEDAKNIMFNGNLISEGFLAESEIWDGPQYLRFVNYKNKYYFCLSFPWRRVLKYRCYDDND